MVTDDVGFDVLVTQARLEQWLVDNGLVPMTDPSTTPLLAAWGHVGLHGIPTEHCIDGTWVDAPCCCVSPCKAADHGAPLALAALDECARAYWDEWKRRGPQSERNQGDQ